VAILIPRRLQHAGIGYEEALSLLGKLQGMAMNIAFFPMLITSAFNVLLIPSIAELVASKNKRLLMHRINSAIGLASFTACLTASILLSAPIKLGGFFYNDYTVGVILKVIAPVLPLIYLELLSYAIINGLGLQIKLLINSIVVQSLDLILLYIFVGDSRFKIYGYAINISISSLLGIMVNYRLIIKNTQLKINWALIVVIPFLCGIATYIIASNIIFIYCDVPIAIVITSIFYFGLYISSNKLLHNSSIIVKNLF
jgi:stage V sporulation protein B